MKPIVYFCCVVFLCYLQSCERDSGVDNYSAEWVEGDYTLAEYQKLSGNRDILVFYNSDWGTTGHVMMKEMETELKGVGILGEKEVLFVRYDCTLPDSVGSKEFKKLKLHVMPSFVLIKKNGDKVIYHLEKYWNDKRGFLEAMKKEIE